MMNERNVRWTSSKPSLNNMENWNREADVEAERCERFIRNENKIKKNS